MHPFHPLSHTHTQSSHRALPSRMVQHHRWILNPINHLWSQISQVKDEHFLHPAQEALLRYLLALSQGTRSSWSQANPKMGSISVSSWGCPSTATKEAENP